MPVAPLRPLRGQLLLRNACGSPRWGRSFVVDTRVVSASPSAGRCACCLRFPIGRPMRVWRGRACPPREIGRAKGSRPVGGVWCERTRRRMGCRGSRRCRAALGRVRSEAAMLPCGNGVICRHQRWSRREARPATPVYRRERPDKDSLPNDRHCGVVPFAALLWPQFGGAPGPRCDESRKRAPVGRSGQEPATG